MRVLALLGCGLALALSAGVSRAQEAPAPNTLPPAPVYAAPPPGSGPPVYYYAPPPGYEYAPLRPKRTWYGWQTLATDGAAFMLLYGAGRSRNSDMAYGSLAVYSLGAPIVHMAHGNPGRGLFSLAVRSLPALTIFGDKSSRNDDMLLLTILSVPAMIAIDAAALAREDEEPRPAPSHGVRVVPMASANARGGTVGLSGIF